MCIDGFTLNVVFAFVIGIALGFVFLILMVKLFGPKVGLVVILAALVGVFIVLGTMNTNDLQSCTSALGAWRSGSALP